MLEKLVVVAIDIVLGAIAVWLTILFLEKVWLKKDLKKTGKPDEK